MDTTKFDDTMDSLKQYFNQATSQLSKYASYCQCAYDDSILLQHSSWWVTCLPAIMVQSFSSE